MDSSTRMKGTTMLSEYDLIGKTIERIYMDEQYLTFFLEGDEYASFEVKGDCCSSSYFYDFYGVENLIGNKILSFEEVSLSKGDVGYREEAFESDNDSYYRGGSYVDLYGGRFTVEHSMFGEVSAVFSFRNFSNGYYGGTMYAVEKVLEDEKYRIIKDFTF